MGERGQSGIRATVISTQNSDLKLSIGNRFRTSNFEICFSLRGNDCDRPRNWNLEKTGFVSAFHCFDNPFPEPGACHVDQITGTDDASD